MKQLMLKQHGFTVVELIIVIVVISILATISIVSYNSVRNDSVRGAYEATAQQVKLKLGEHYTDNNHYPMDKDDVETYLAAVNAGSSLIADFEEDEYVYAAYTDSTAATPCASEAACQHYRISVAKTNWNGGSADEDILVEP